MNLHTYGLVYPAVNDRNDMNTLALTSVRSQFASILLVRLIKASGTIQSLIAGGLG